MAMVKLTKAILFQGRSIMGGYSQAQLMLFGVVGRVSFDIWGKQILGREYPQELIDKFISLKDKHIFNRTVRNQLREKERRRAKKAGEEYRKDSDIFAGTARKMVNGIETIYRVGPPMTPDEARQFRMERMKRGILENGTMHCWTGVDGKKPKGNPTSISGQKRKLKRDAERAAIAAGTVPADYTVESRLGLPEVRGEDYRGTKVTLGEEDEV